MKVPEHIAIILDGNGRWAKAKGMPRAFGHNQGSKNVDEMCDIMSELGVKYFTVYAFSTENWKRPSLEVKALLTLFRQYLKTAPKRAARIDMRTSVIGDRSALPEDIVELIEIAEEATKDNKGLHFQLAMNYGSRDEIRRGVTKLARQVKEGLLDPSDITEDTISGMLDTAGIPDPDLLIRTSGEQRLSNFLLWQLAYSEFYFTDKHWPDFDKDELMSAIEWFNNRDRRFGNIKEE